MSELPVMTIETLAGWAAERCESARGRNARVRAGGQHTHALVEHMLFGLDDVLFPMPMCGCSGAWYDLAAIELTDSVVDCALCIALIVAGQRGTAAAPITTRGPLQPVLFALGVDDPTALNPF